MRVETNSSSLQDWLGKFRKRRGGLSLRKVESVSLTQTMVFNRHNLKLFSTVWKSYIIALKFHWKWSGFYMKLE